MVNVMVRVLLKFIATRLKESSTRLSIVGLLGALGISSTVGAAGIELLMAAILFVIALWPEKDKTTDDDE